MLGKCEGAGPIFACAHTPVRARTRARARARTHARVATSVPGTLPATRARTRGRWRVGTELATRTRTGASASRVHAGARDAGTHAYRGATRTRWGERTRARICLFSATAPAVANVTDRPRHPGYIRVTLGASIDLGHGGQGMRVYPLDRLAGAGYISGRLTGLAVSRVLDRPGRIGYTGGQLDGSDSLPV